MPNDLPHLDRPGPQAITPRQAPGGLVLRIYDRAHRLLIDAQLYADTNLDELTDLHAELLDRLNAGDVCLVAYDGDTGHRFDAIDWASVGFTPGDRLDLGG